MALMGEDSMGSVRHDFCGMVAAMHTASNISVQPELGQMASAVAYDFRNPLHVSELGNSLLLADLAATSAFRRLDDIRFLGAIDYRWVPSPNGSAIRYTRQQHSLGVLKLALRYCAIRDLSTDDCNVVCTAALLHDIGHPPLSHSMEPVFAECFGIDHHQATQDIIYGRVALGRDVLRALRSHNVDIERVASLVAQQNSDFDRFFAGPITFDTIEGISRSHMYLKHSQPAPSPHDVMLAAANRHRGDERLVDGFWLLKNKVYSFFINSPKGIVTDFAAQQILRQHLGQIKAEDYYSTEHQVFRKLPELDRFLKDPSVEQNFGMPETYVDRKYFIDSTGDFHSRQDQLRYQHIKRRRKPADYSLPYRSEQPSITMPLW